MSSLLPLPDLKLTSTSVATSAQSRRCCCNTSLISPRHSSHLSPFNGLRSAELSPLPSPAPWSEEENKRRLGGIAAPCCTVRVVSFNQMGRTSRHVPLEGRGGVVGGVGYVGCRWVGGMGCANPGVEWGGGSLKVQRIYWREKVPLKE